MVKHKNIRTKQNEEECLCCGFKGNSIGVLFQVNSCRGCASFFKRSITLGLQFRCISGDYQCQIKSGSKMCRFCRLKKCIKVGMTLKVKNEESEKRFKENLNIELALQTFGYDDENCIFVVKNDQVLEIGPDNRYPDELFTDDPFERRKIMRSGFETFITELYKPIKKLKLDRIELSFLIIQILWSHKKRDDLSENTFSMMEKILKVASTELQHYYIYEKKTDNYSWRLVEITKLIAKSTEAATLLSDNFLKAKILGQFGPNKWSSTDSVICPLI
uniref:Nuclear receptor domain-containing protein n=1 Tax=Rhabditophanes sp. KR3021 TaxID=114890 RepID=A0AC35TXL4_9BILA